MVVKCINSCNNYSTLCYGINYFFQNCWSSKGPANVPLFGNKMLAKIIKLKWGQTVLVFVWLSSLSIMPSRSIHVVPNSMIFLFLMTKWRPLCVYVCMSVYIYIHIDIPIHLLYPFICWQTLRLSPHLGSCEQCCNTHGEGRYLSNILLSRPLDVQPEGQ